MKNMFEHPLTIYSTISQETINIALREAGDLMASALAGDYKRTAPDVLAEFVTNALDAEALHLTDYWRAEGQQYNASRARKVLSDAFEDSGSSENDRPSWEEASKLCQYMHGPKDTQPAA